VSKTDDPHQRLECACERLCKLMGWQPRVTHKWTAIRKIAMGEATAISVERIEDLCKRLDAPQEGRTP